MGQASKDKIGWPEVSLKEMTKLTKIHRYFLGPPMCQLGWGHAHITASSPHFTDKAER